MARAVGMHLLAAPVDIMAGGDRDAIATPEPADDSSALLDHRACVAGGHAGLAILGSMGVRLSASGRGGDQGQTDQGRGILGKAEHRVDSSGTGSSSLRGSGGSGAGVRLLPGRGILLTPLGRLDLDGGTATDQIRQPPRLTV